MKAINIGKRKIGPGYPVFIIAEGGINHNGHLHIAKSLVDVAVESNADAIKFQKRDLKTLYIKEILDDHTKGEQGIQYMLPILKETELSDEDFIQIRDYCKKKSIMFLCTPWDIPSANFLNKLDIPIFKVASADLTNFLLLEVLCSYNKPLILSTGMSTLEEIDEAVNFLNRKKAEFILLHCCSTYPTPFQNVNLNVIKTFQNRYNAPIGYSGHENGIVVSSAAVSMGACVIERHITLNRTMKGPDHAASLEPYGLKKQIRDIRNIELAMGSSKKWISRGEVMNKEVLGKSIYAACDVSKGQIIKRNMLTIKSPFKAISGNHINKLIGTTAKRKINKYQPFIENDLNYEKHVSAVFPKDKKIGFVVRSKDLKSIHNNELYAVEFHLSDKDVELKKWKKNGRKYKQELVLHAPEYWGHELFDPCSLDSKVRTMSRDIIKRTIDLGRKMNPSFEGCRGKPLKIVLHPGGITRYSPDGINSKLYEILEQSLLSFKDKDVELLLENMPPLPWYFGGQWRHSIFLGANEIAKFCEKTGSNICFDLSHAQLYCNKNNKNLEKYIKRVKPFIRHIHLADAAGWDGEGLQIGEGDIDFEKALALLEALDVINILEIWQGHKFDGKGFHIALDRLNKNWNRQDPR